MYSCSLASRANLRLRPCCVTLLQWTACSPKLLSVPLKQLAPWRPLGQVTRLQRLSSCMRSSLDGQPSAFLHCLKQWLLRQLTSGEDTQFWSRMPHHTGPVKAALSALRVIHSAMSAWVIDPPNLVDRVLSCPTASVVLQACSCR